MKCSCKYFNFQTDKLEQCTEPATEVIDPATPTERSQLCATCTVDRAMDRLDEKVSNVFSTQRNGDSSLSSDGFWI